MLEILSHKDDPRYYYTRYSGKIDGNTAHANWRFFDAYVKDVQDIQYITEYVDSLELMDRDFISIMAVYADKYQGFIGESVIVGIKGYRKLLWKVFETISFTQYKRKLMNSMEAVEQFFDIDIKRDFEVVHVFKD